MVPITFSNGDESFEALALLDSGADQTAMSQEMAEALGLDLNGSKSTAFGIGGKVDCVNSKVNISI